MIKNDVNSIDENTTDGQKVARKEAKTKDLKVLYLIYQCVDADEFEKIKDCEFLKQAWKILKKSYIGPSKANKLGYKLTKKTRIDSNGRERKYQSLCNKNHKISESN